MEASMPECLRGLEHISRFWDKRHNTFSAKILPGEYYVSMHGELISTVLGSCISACIRDKKMGIGGMNHFMLPMGCEDEHAGKIHLTSATRYGNFAMEMLINEILKAGGSRKNLEVKLFGGGRVLSSMTKMDIGKKNINFVHEYLEEEGLKIIAEDMGDIYPRKVLFFADTGKVRVKKLQNMHNETIKQREENYRKSIDEQPVQSDIELF
ncbi:MAG: chemoreceptor glutamine deamidase CheD [endosymbiont of Galathealinum brachiosum]|uniref:Probable chemoreceptor glutamine deamidase CheD n=1 Tax=endosymbiont of Galathealinum brachiosum TaxID=2200906 RepID=A0A370DJH6_9GAMM|nr:MAG: chemoreceptor glutamine deamidase CheD [endosymbiont of Galathealinum brachiosum]